MYVRIGTFDAPPTQLDELIKLFRTRAFQRFSELDGFIGYSAYVDRSLGRFVGISMWASREALDASSEAGRLSRKEAETLGARWIGHPQLLECAFEKKL